METSRNLLKYLKLDIDSESVHVYLDKGEDQEIISVCYWHLDEVEEDPSVALAIAYAVDLYHRNPIELLVSLALSVSAAAELKNKQDHE